MLGCSRDHPFDCYQVVTGLPMTREGIPVVHRVFPGNTAGAVAAQPVLQELRQRFRPGRVILVAVTIQVLLTFLVTNAKNGRPAGRQRVSVSMWGMKNTNRKEKVVTKGCERSSRAPEGCCATIYFQTGGVPDSQRAQALVDFSGVSVARRGRGLYCHSDHEAKRKPSQHGPACSNCSKVVVKFKRSGPPLPFPEPLMVSW